MRRTAIITGSTRGIGRAIGIELLKNGCDVAFNYSKSLKYAQELQEELNKFGFQGRYQIVQADLSKMDGVQQMISNLEPKFRALNYLILNAAETDRCALKDLTHMGWESVLQTNLTVPLFLVQACAPWLQSGGCVLFIGAVMGQFPHAMSLSYGATKAAIHYLTRGLVKEFAAQQVRVNCIAPGFVETDWQLTKPIEIRKSIEEKIVLHRFATSEEIAQCAKMVLENRYINGSIVNIDGGYCYR